MFKYIKINMLMALVTLSTITTLYAAEVSLDSVTWDKVGYAGLISSNYNQSGFDAPLGPSATGNGMFAFVSTYDALLESDPNAPINNPSPLILNDTDGAFNQTNGAMYRSSIFNASTSSNLSLYFNYVSTDGRGYEDYAWARLVSNSDKQTAAWLYTARSGNAPDNNGTGDYVPGNVLKDQVGFDNLDSKDPNRSIAAVLNEGNPVIGIINNTQWDPLGTSAGSCWDIGTSCGYTGWVKSDYIINETGDYYIEIGVSNWGDSQFQSALAFDYVGLQQGNFLVSTTFQNELTTPIPEPKIYGLFLFGIFLLLINVRQSKKYSF